MNFYKATELPEFKIDNVDQRVTTDVEQFCEQGCEMFCDVFKPSTSADQLPTLAALLPVIFCRG